jgi:FkbM family methyltransferase
LRGQFRANGDNPLVRELRPITVAKANTVDGLVNSSPFLDYLAEITTPGTFQLVDVGCSGGIDRRWRRMGRRLQALGIDPDIDEIARLQAREKNPAVTYLNAFAGIGANHPFALKRRGKLAFARDPNPRMSTVRFVEKMRKQSVTGKEKRSSNLWQGAKLADPAASVVVPEYLKSAGIASVDFLKIDVDGKDFEILNSFDRTLDDLKIMGVGIEVRVWGSDEETDGTFHNVDRFMKAHGFELFNLSLRRYSTTALPSRFVARAPGATELGRVHHGDAMYARDLGSGLYDELAKSFSTDKLLNLAAVFAIFDLPDCAAEVATKFRAQLAMLGDVDRMLDRLTAQLERSRDASYRRHMERFENEPQEFLGTKNPLVLAAHAWKRGYAKWRGRRELLRIERKG